MYLLVLLDVHRQDQIKVVFNEILKNVFNEIDEMSQPNKKYSLGFKA